MYRVSSKSLEEQKHPRLKGGEFYFSLTERKHGTVIFLTLRHCIQHKTYFCFLLTLIVKNTLHLVDGNIRLQLVESFSNFGLHLSEELLITRAVLASKQSWTILYKRSTNLEKVTLEPIPVKYLLRLFKISILIKQNHEWVPTPGREKPRAFY